jgi:hypothetical protein
MCPGSNEDPAAGSANQRPDNAEPRARQGLADPGLTVAELSHEAWLRSGRPFPSYTRATMPVRIIKLSDDR